MSYFNSDSFTAESAPTESDLRLTIALDFRRLKQLVHVPAPESFRGGVLSNVFTQTLFPGSHYNPARIAYELGDLEEKVLALIEKYTDAVKNKAKADIKEWSSKYAEAHRTIDELNDKQISTTLLLKQEKDRAGNLAILVQKYRHDMEVTQAELVLVKNSQKILSDRYLTKLLGELEFLPRAPSVQGALDFFRPTDSEIARVAHLCDEAGNTKGAQQPRTFLVCYMLERLDYMDGFEGADIDLPYTKHQLQLSGHLSPADQDRFLEYQEYVLTEAFHRSKKLQTSGNEHQILAGDASTQFGRNPKFLGKGASGTVYKAFGLLSLKTFAWKRMPLASFTSAEGTRLGSFENELSNLKRLSHRHLVKFVGSYTDDKEVGILMMPVANMNLKEYLALAPADSRRDAHCARLRSFFGCIAIAIEYLHREKIRHKDIKPGNILVKGRQVYITDFGTSYDWTNAQSDFTDGTNRTVYTAGYASPEVVWSRVSTKRHAALTKYADMY